MKLTVAIATTGRPQIAAEAIRDLACQTRPADRIILSIATPDDVIGCGETTSPSVEVLTGRKGLTFQRNAVLDALGQEDVLLFLDDDFVMAADYLARLETILTARADVSVVTGNVLADGIGNAGLTLTQAHDILARAVAPMADETVEVNNGYGCNMAFRCAPIREHDLRFDERLPLYGWLEDVDFSRRVAAHGKCVKAASLRGVHLGTKGGRTSGLRLGYSQVANPVHLVRQHTMRVGHALRMIGRNMLANVGKSMRPEPWVDRRGRLHGNLIALADLVRGRLDPERVVHMDIRTDGRS